MNVGRIVVCGLVTNGCVQIACLDGLKLGFEVFLADGAHSTWHKDAEKLIIDWNQRLAAEGVMLFIYYAKRTG